MKIPLPQTDIDKVILLTHELWSHMRNKRILLTGGTGFIGSWLLEVMQGANDDLNVGMQFSVLTRNAVVAKKNHPHLFDRGDTYILEGDISEPLKHKGSWDICVHAATDVEASLQAINPLTTFKSIADGTEHVLAFSKSSGVSRFLLLSSGAVYGEQPQHLEKIPEDYLGSPKYLDSRSAYGCGKKVSEWIATSHKRDDFEPVIARIFALIGPGMPLKGSFAAGNFLQDVLHKRSILIKGDGSSIRSYLYMVDLCTWLLNILVFGKSGIAYNVGSESPHSILELANLFSGYLDQNQNEKIGVSNVANNLASRYIPNTSLAREDLGLIEYTPIDIAIQKTLQWSREANV
jgi:dTDP-glucose 4,6-dehydratase